jgi:hypothetical protein
VHVNSKAANGFKILNDTKVMQALMLPDIDNQGETIKRRQEEEDRKEAER